MIMVGMCSQALLRKKKKTSKKYMKCFTVVKVSLVIGLSYQKIDLILHIYPGGDRLGCMVTAESNTKF